MGTQGTQILCWGCMEVTAKSPVSEVEKASLGPSAVEGVNLEASVFPVKWTEGRVERILG